MASPSFIMELTTPLLPLPSTTWFDWNLLHNNSFIYTANSTMPIASFRVWMKLGRIQGLFFSSLLKIDSFFLFSLSFSSLLFSSLLFSSLLLSFSLGWISDDVEWDRQQGRMSNFQYLMHLNTMAGRGYNDLTQYPVFFVFLWMFCFVLFMDIVFVVFTWFFCIFLLFFLLLFCCFFVEGLINDN